MFVLRLPNSQIEVDMPLISSCPVSPQPDQGLLPDLYIKPKVEDLVKGIDAELQAVKRLIATQSRRAR
jgi:hypothetical protein